MPPRLSPRKIFLVIIIFFFTTLLVSRTNKSLWIAKREARHEEAAPRENILENGKKQKIKNYQRQSVKRVCINVMLWEKEN